MPGPSAVFGPVLRRALARRNLFTLAVAYRLATTTRYVVLRKQIQRTLRLPPRVISPTGAVEPSLGSFCQILEGATSERTAARTELTYRYEIDPNTCVRRRFTLGERFQARGRLSSPSEFDCVID